VSGGGRGGAGAPPARRCRTIGGRWPAAGARWRARLVRRRWRAAAEAAGAGGGGRRQGHREEEEKKGEEKEE